MEQRVQAGAAKVDLHLGLQASKRWSSSELQSVSKTRFLSREALQLASSGRWGRIMP